MDQHGQRGLVLLLFGLCEAKAVNFGNPFGRGEEKLPVILALGDQDAIEADIVDDNTMRKALHTESDEVVMAISFDLQPGGNALAGRDGDFERGVGSGTFDEVGGGWVIG